MKRCALTIAAGPKYWPSVQKTGQDEVQAAHRMHLVVSSKRSRSSTGCRRSLVGSWPLLIRNGMTSRKDWKKGSMSTIRSFSTGRPLIGSTGGGLGGLVEQERNDFAEGLEEGFHVHDQVLLHREALDRLDGDGLGRVQVLQQRLAGEAVAAVDAHGIGSTDAVGAGAAEGYAAVDFPLDLVQG